MSIESESPPPFTPLARYNQPTLSTRARALAREEAESRNRTSKLRWGLDIMERSLTPPEKRCHNSPSQTQRSLPSTVSRGLTARRPNNVKTVTHMSLGGPPGLQALENSFSLLQNTNGLMHALASRPPKFLSIVELRLLAHPHTKVASWFEKGSTQEHLELTGRQGALPANENDAGATHLPHKLLVREVHDGEHPAVGDNIYRKWAAKADQNSKPPDSPFNPHSVSEIVQVSSHRARRSTIGNHHSERLQRVTALLSKKPIERTIEDRKQLFELLRHLKAFQSLSEFLLLELCGVLQLDDFDAHRVVFNQGDRGTSWYVVLQGQVDVIVRREFEDDLRPSSGAPMVRVAHLVTGDGFGELSLINDARRMATIFTVVPCLLLRAEKEDYVRILRFIHRKDHKDKALFLSEAPLTKDLPPGVHESIANVLAMSTYPAGATIIRRGSPVDRFYILKKGICDVFAEITVSRSDRQSTENEWKKLTRPVAEEHTSSKLNGSSLKQSRYAFQNRPWENQESSTLEIWLGSYEPYQYFGQIAVLGASDSESSSNVTSSVTVRCRTTVEVASMSIPDVRVRLRSQEDKPLLSPDPLWGQSKDELTRRFKYLVYRKKWDIFRSFVKKSLST